MIIYFCAVLAEVVKVSPVNRDLCKGTVRITIGFTGNFADVTFEE